MKCQGEILLGPRVWVEEERSQLPDTPFLHSPARVVIIIFNAK